MTLTRVLGTLAGLKPHFSIVCYDAYPMHMMRLIMEMESRLTCQNVMKPRTPSSMEMIAKATQREHTGLGMNMSEMNIITTAAITTHWIVVGRTTRN